MSQLYLHIGFAKCASTSFQSAASKSELLFYPESGRCLDEHLGFALHFRGIDEYTAQWYSDNWVSENWSTLTEEINNANRPIFISSERLAGSSELEIRSMAKYLSPFNVSVIVLIRDRNRYLNSTWRHSVFKHDYHVPLSDFIEQSAGFSFDPAINRFMDHFNVSVFNIDSCDWIKEFNHKFDLDFELPKLNTGIPLKIAELLCNAQRTLGSKTYKEIFTRELKDRILAEYKKDCSSLDGFKAPLF